VPASVSHSCNPNYSGGRDQENLGGQPGEIVCETQSQKCPTQKWAEVVVQVIEDL
jgi:hypothetical protein